MANIKNVVLISTRPEENNRQLVNEMVNKDIEVLSCPLTEITALDDYAQFDHQLGKLHAYQHLIFISTNAVKFFMQRVKLNLVALPSTLIVSAIGPTTKKLLQKNLHLAVHCPKDTYDSESLIKLNIFHDLTGQKILIVRGRGGREALKQLLEQNGASVHYAECYQRNYLHIDLTGLKKRVEKFSHRYFLITSLESAKKFKSDVNEKDLWLNNSFCLVNHESIAQELGGLFKKIVKLRSLKSDLIEKELLHSDVH